MPGIFQEYKIALLDSSFFMSPFPQDVRDGLKEIKVYVADTFNSEIEQYKTLLSKKRCGDYNNNIDFLNQNMKLNTLNLDSFGARSESLHNDVWGLITLFKSVNPSAKIIVVTANTILMQRIILHNIGVDIYNLNDRCILYSDKYLSMKSLFEYKETDCIGEQPSQERVTKGSLLYKSNGSPIILGDVIKSGVESNLHKIQGSSTLIAKVFKKDKLSSRKIKNIKKLAGINTRLEISWALFPMDVLYYDQEAKAPAGFTESFAAVEKDLGDNPLFAGQLDDLPDESLNTKLSNNIELCLKVTRQVCYLNNFGFLVSDFNMNNFATIKNDGSNIQMWDTDSFGYDTYFSGYCAGDKTTKEYDIAKKEGAIDFCSEALYLFVFSILSLGDTPISEFTGKFKYENPNYIAQFRKRLFPDNIWQLFEDVFTGKKLPSVEVLLRQLVVSLNSLEEEPDSNKTYGELLSDVLSESTEIEQQDDPIGDVPLDTSSKTKKGLPGWLWFLLVVGAIILIAVFKSQQ